MGNIIGINKTISTLCPTECLTSVQSKGCFSQVWDYIVALVKWALDDKKGSKPTSPSWVCWAEVGFVGLFGILLFGVISFYGSSVVQSFLQLFPALNGILGIFKTVFGGLFNSIKSIAVYSETTIENVAQYLVQIVQLIVYSWRYLVDGANDISAYLDRLLGVNIYLSYANVYTLAALAITEVLREFLNLEIEWEDSSFYYVFKILNWPLTTFMNAIVDLIGEEGNAGILFILKTLIIPFEGGTFVVSIILGTILYLLDELIEAIKDNDSDFQKK